MSNLGDELRALHAARERELRERWDRSLPFAEGVFDRWERARALGWGEDASVYDSAFVLGDVEVGASTWIGPYTMLDGSGGPLRIGAFCSISAGVQLSTHDTVHWALSGGLAEARCAAVSIGDRCYVGPQAVVGPGVSIGDMSVVGATSFVNRDVPPRTVVAGLPARPIGRVEGDGDGVQLVYDVSDGAR